MAEGDGDGSYWKLIRNIYGKNAINIYLANNYKENGSNVQSDGIILQKHFSFIRSGNYNYGNGILSGTGQFGYYLEAYVSSNNYTRYLDISSQMLHPQNGNYKGFGFSLRCVAK